MTRPFPCDVELIERFLRTHQFRHAATSKNYAGILRNFTNFLLQQGAGAPPTVPIVQQWLKERSLKWSLHMLYHRTFLNAVARTRSSLTYGGTAVWRSSRHAKFCRQIVIWSQSERSYGAAAQPVGT